MDILAEAAALDPPLALYDSHQAKAAGRQERTQPVGCQALPCEEKNSRSKTSRQIIRRKRRRLTHEFLGYAVNILDKTVEHTEDWESLCDKYRHLYEKQRAANDEQETQITILDELIDQKGDFIKELADICRVQRQAPEPVAVRGYVSPSLTSSAQENGCNEYGDV